MLDIVAGPSALLTSEASNPGVRTTPARHKLWASFNVTVDWSGFQRGG